MSKSFEKYFAQSLRTGCIVLLLLPLLAANAAGAAKGVLWELQAGGQTAYLFGSIHVARADFYPLAPAVERAYQAARVLAVEVDSTDAAALASAMPLMTYTAPDKLEQHLSAATWHTLQGMLGAGAAQFQALKPAIAASALLLGIAQTQGYAPQDGIDVHFIGRAKADGKAIQELETLAFQAQVLTDFSDAEGDEMVSATLSSLKSGAAMDMINQMAAAWKSGDVAALERILQQEAQQDAGTARMMQRLLDERNPGMCEKILALLASGKTALIVVGAGHMTGANGIVPLLQRRGVQVRRLE